jgi:hypothetical protein
MHAWRARTLGRQVKTESKGDGTNTPSRTASTVKRPRYQQQQQLHPQANIATATSPEVEMGIGNKPSVTQARSERGLGLPAHGFAAQQQDFGAVGSQWCRHIAAYSTA